MRAMGFVRLAIPKRDDERKQMAWKILKRSMTISWLAFRLTLSLMLWATAAKARHLRR
jgi:hypothetical protein